MFFRRPRLRMPALIVAASLVALAACTGDVGGGPCRDLSRRDADGRARHAGIDGDCHATGSGDDDATSDRDGDRRTEPDRDDLPHTVTAQDDSTDSGFLLLNDTYSMTFNAPGTFAYYCTVHPFMTATVTIQ